MTDAKRIAAQLSPMKQPQTTADMAVFVQNLLQQMQSRFQAMSDNIVGRIDEMGSRIDELENQIGQLIHQAGVVNEDTEGTESIRSPARAATSPLQR